MKILIDGGRYPRCLWRHLFCVFLQRISISHRRRPRSRFLFQSFAACALSVGLAGCGLHYYDPDTGIDHVWGIGHLKMKLTAPAEGVRAAVTGVQLVGVGIGVGQTDYYAQIGWRDARMLRVLQESTCVRLDWPSTDIFSIRVGTIPPNVKPDPSLSQRLLEESCR